MLILFTLLKEYNYKQPYTIILRRLIGSKLVVQNSIERTTDYKIFKFERVTKLDIKH